MKIPLAVNSIRESDVLAAIDVLRSGELTMGKKVLEFERQMQSYLKTKHFIMVNSGSSANLAMIEALLRPVKGNARIRLGEAVLVPAIAWPTTVWPLIQLGVIPLFVDVDVDSLNIDWESAQRTINESKIKVAAIFPIHVLGCAIPDRDLKRFATENNLFIISDVCESLGSWDGEMHSGGGGLASSFSFYFSHHITTMEGGGIATNDDELADDLRSIRSHGWSRDRSDSHEWVTIENEIDSKFMFVSTGFNIRPMEIQAAIGISQVQDIDSFIQRRRKIAQRVSTVLRGAKIKLIGADYVNGRKASNEHSWMLLPLQIDISQVDRKDLMKIKREVVGRLNKKGIETRPPLTGNFLAQPGFQRFTQGRQEPKEFPNANLVASSTFLVGCHHDFSEEQIEYLVESIYKVVQSF